MPIDKQSKQTFLLGTAVKIYTVLDTANPATITITIDDPSETEKVSNASMTKESDKIYSYIFQTSTSYDEGDWVITIKATWGVYTSTAQEIVTLEDQQ